MSMNRYVKAISATIIANGLIFGSAACSSDAEVTSQNISKDADNFKIERRVVFFNGITDKYLLTIEGLCSIDASDAKKLAVTCKTGPNVYKKHYLGLSDNVTYFVEQTTAAKEDPYHYKVVFKPEAILPDIKLKTSVTDNAGDSEDGTTYSNYTTTNHINLRHSSTPSHYLT